MKIYTDATKMHFYADDKIVKNLELIEIQSIKDYLYYGLDMKCLVDARLFTISHHNELIARDYKDVHYETDVFEIEFLKDMSYIDIMMELSDTEFCETWMKEVVEQNSSFSFEDVSDEFSTIHLIRNNNDKNKVVKVTETETENGVDVKTVMLLTESA